MLDFSFFIVGIIILPAFCTVMLTYNLIAMDLIVEVFSFAFWFFAALVYMICLKEVKTFLIISHLYEIEILRFLINLDTLLVFLPGIILFTLILIHIFFG